MVLVAPIQSVISEMIRLKGADQLICERCGSTGCRGTMHAVDQTAAPRDRGCRASAPTTIFPFVMGLCVRWAALPHKKKIHDTSVMCLLFVLNDEALNAWLFNQIIF